jgi:hypothetical protein
MHAIVFGTPCNRTGAYVGPLHGLLLTSASQARPCAPIEAEPALARARLPPATPLRRPALTLRCMQGWVGLAARTG